MTTPRSPGTGHPAIDSPALQGSAYTLAHLHACIESGDPARVDEALAAIPEWVSFYEVRELLARGGMRLRMQPVRVTALATHLDGPRRRVGD